MSKENNAELEKYPYKLIEQKKKTQKEKRRGVLKG